MHKLSDLAALVGGTVKGDGDVAVSGLCSIDKPHPGCIAYLERHKEAAKLNGAELAAVVTTENLAHFAPNAIVVSQPKLAFIDIMEHLIAEPARPGAVHPRAIVHESAEVDPAAIIEAGAVLEAGARVGPRSCIGAGTCLGPQASVGADCVIGPNVTIYHDVRIGDRVRIIGASGFGFVPTRDGHRRFPQVGTVVIEDDVEIGSNCCVDRASLDNTVVHKGTKIDNLVQVAHGVTIGEHTMIAAQTGISGGTSIGNWCVVGGQAGFQACSATCRSRARSRVTRPSRTRRVSRSWR
jgi:UDP-3-O-[3-hydroxymyristoyl] glucosamine N-acyltransferase